MNQTKKIVVIIFIIIKGFGNYTAQNSTKAIDSLLQVLKTSKIDTTYIKNLNMVARKYIDISQNNEAKKCIIKARQTSDLLNYKNGNIKANINECTIYINLANFDSAIIFANNTLKIIDIQKNKYDASVIYSQLGHIYGMTGNYKLGIENILKSIKLNEELKDEKSLANNYSNLGSIYHFQMKDDDKALLYFFKALQTAQSCNYVSSIANTYNNIGLIYTGDKNNTDTALFYLLKSIELKEKLGNKKGLANSFMNVGRIYGNKNKYDDALKYYRKSLVMKAEIGDKKGLVESYLNLSDFYYSKKNDLLLAEKYSKEAVEMAILIRDKEQLKNCYALSVRIYEKKEDYKEALKFQKLYTTIKDSMFNTESNKQITEMNTKYETEIKDKELIKKDSEIKMQQANSEKQAIVRNGFIIGFVFLLGLIVFIYRGYSQKQRTNKLLNDKNQKITDSINYAKLIQSSILPPLEEINRYMPNSFIFYQPKDIVSGDFYWLHPLNDHTSLFAVIDCTGHGVPGAMMSMLGYSLLEQIINQDKMFKPSEILDQLNNLVLESLKQSGSVDSVKNGMDMALFKIDFLNNELEYAGAKNSIYILRDQNVLELKADRKSIGLSNGNSNKFNNQNFKLQDGDQLFAFSDGYVDQKGGAENKKFYSANFQKLLISINALPIKNQEEEIKIAFANWKGAKEQVDDVLVFGIKI